MKINKLKLAIVIVAVIAIIVISITYIIFKDTNKKDNENTIDNSVTVEENKINIKSTKNNRIENGDIEIENLEITIVGSQLKVIATIKNNSKVKINGTSMDIALLDANNEEIDTFMAGVSKTIEPQESVQETYYLISPKSPEKIRGAKIVNIEQSEGIEKMEEDFNETIESTEGGLQEPEDSITSEEAEPNVYGPQSDEE